MEPLIAHEILNDTKLIVEKIEISIDMKRDIFIMDDSFDRL